MTVEERLDKIEDRNRRVETEKAWETSWTRKVSIVVLTYITISIFLYAIKVPNPLINAIVPVVGFILSTLSVPFIRRIWKKRN